jgi:hypothetical protein
VNENLCSSKELTLLHYNGGEHTSSPARVSTATLGAVALRAGPALHHHVEVGRRQGAVADFSASAHATDAPRYFSLTFVRRAEGSLASPRRRAELRRAGAHDERVEAAPGIAFPARHGRDGGLRQSVAADLRDLLPARRVAFAALRDCDFGAVLRALAAFASARLAAAFFATCVGLMGVLLAIALTRRCLRDATP